MNSTLRFAMAHIDDSTRSKTAAAAALVHISGLHSDTQSSRSASNLDTVLALPIDQLTIKLDSATSDELRILKAYIGEFSSVRS